MREKEKASERGRERERERGRTRERENEREGERSFLFQERKNTCSGVRKCVSNTWNVRILRERERSERESRVSDTAEG